jgi:hypothetical protein
MSWIGNGQKVDETHSSNHHLLHDMAERQLTAEEQQEKEDKERADKLKNTNGLYFFLMVTI